MVVIEVPIEQIRPNPFRDFDLDPINSERVEEIRFSMERNYFWGALPARKVRDTDPVEYEIACGHHRLEAAKQIGFETVQINDWYISDKDMLSIMIDENLTQRGNETFSAVLDATAAAIVQIVKNALSDDPSNICYWGKEFDWATVKGHILNGQGVGRRSVEFFTKGALSRRQAGTAIGVLNATGKYHKLIEKGGASEDIVELYFGKPYVTIGAFHPWKKTSHANAFLNVVAEPVVMKYSKPENHEAWVRNFQKNHSDGQFTAKTIVQAAQKDIREAFRGRDNKSAKSTEKRIEEVIKLSSDLISKIQKIDMQNSSQLIESDDSNHGQVRHLWRLLNLIYGEPQATDSTSD